MYPLRLCVSLPLRVTIFVRAFFKIVVVLCQFCFIIGKGDRAFGTGGSPVRRAIATKFVTYCAHGVVSKQGTHPRVPNLVALVIL